jgi:antitoxin component YwqK of YwqJK toxin-antitoxin module
MKKAILTITAIIVSFSFITAQTSIEIINGLAYNADNELMDGKYYTTYEDGTIKEELNYQNGVKQGAFLAYYEDGALKEQGLFTDNQKDGRWTKWAQNGNKIGDIHFKNGIKDGKWRIWDANGTLRYLVFYDMGEKNRNMESI